MRQIAPSEAVAFVDRVFGDLPKRQQQTWEAKGKASEFGGLPGPDYESAVAALSKLLDYIPPALITHRAEDFIGAKAAIEQSLTVWAGSNRNALLGPAIRGFDPLHPITLIRRSLEGCPDAVPQESTAVLEFLGDEPLQRALRLDISSAFQSFAGQQWKATCVLAGSVLEALLRWALQGRDAEFVIAEAAAQKRLAKEGGFALPKDEWRWSLHHYTELAAELKIIGLEQTMKCRLARDARNLIHPSAEQQRKAVCDRSAALSALAALDAVVSHLTRTAAAARPHPATAAP